MALRFNLIKQLVFFLLCFIAVTKGNANSEELNFNHLWVEDGLSQSSIFAIYKDQKGFMWFGTRRGLNRYDGFEFTHYMHDLKDSNSLSSNAIRTIIGDSRDNLVIQTNDDINYFDRYKNRFTHIPIEKHYYDMIKDRYGVIWACSTDGLFTFNETYFRFDTIQKDSPFVKLFDLTLDNENNFWITGGSNQIIKFNPSTLDYRVFTINSAEFHRNYIECDEEGKLWVCRNNGGLFIFNNQKQSFDKVETGILTKDIIVSSFRKGLDNTLIIGTNGNGISIINTQNYQVKYYNHQPDNPFSLSSNTYYSIFSDPKLKILWLGSYMGGIDYYNKYDKGLNFIYHQPYNKNSIINNNIRSLYYDKNMGHIWVGTRQGISVLDTTHNIIKTFNSEYLNKKGISKPIITRITNDINGYIWICSYKGGVVLYNPRSGQFKKVSDVYSNIDLDPQLGVYDVLMDSKNNIWVATESGTFLFPQNKKGFVFEYAFSKTLLEDRAGRIFIGTTFNGLLVVNSSLQVQKVKLYNGSESERINSLFEAADGQIWVGTGGNGLFKYNPYKNEVKQYTRENGLPDNFISAMVVDSKNNIWVSTYTSVAKHISDGDWFKGIYLEKGVKGKEFNPNSIAISQNGNIYIGSVNGLLKLNINRYRENPYLPKVVFTNLLVNNKVVPINSPKSPLKEDIMFADEINLKYFQNTITLQFTAPDYYMGDKVKFSYKISGENKDWVDIGTNRSINLVNLNHGEYILEVKAINSDGHSLMSGSQLAINILPPLWETLYAFIVYGILVVGLFFIYRNFMKSKLKLSYELLLQKAEKEKQDEINQSRIRLFTDISHEIGTSLTLMNIPLETLNRIEDEELKKNQLAIIDKNVSRLMLLVKKIIGLRKIETGNMPLLAERDDIVAFVKWICSNYEPLARSKKIEYYFDFPKDELITWFDKEKVEFVIFNLLSNAFKFEPEKGKIWISICKETRNIQGESKKAVSIKVNNEGGYIPPEQSENIFKRFYKGNDNHKGFGIGLNLIKSYMEIHKGDIALVSNKESGVTFEVLIPYGESYLSKDEKKTDSQAYEFKLPVFVDTEVENDFADYKPVDSVKIKILIVEDNLDLKKLLRNQLKNNFDIIEAGNGEEGLTKTKNFKPDLVVTDYIMPLMDGVTLCQSIKKDIDIEHIPVIILSAKEDIDDQIKGIEAGADAYITKPFSVNYLNSVIFNLIELRKKLKSKYYISSGQNVDNLEISSIDENFLEKAYMILEKNIDNMQFGIPEFIDQLGVSKYMLYSKIKELTGQTPNDFIISYKLKKAAQIFKSKNIKDTEVYGKLGFNDVSYFRKCFKKQYGLTPSQYIKSNRFMDGASDV